MAKKKAVRKKKPVQRKRVIARTEPLKPSLNALVNALNVAVRKHGIKAVVGLLDEELDRHKRELDDLKVGLGY